MGAGTLRTRRVTKGVYPDAEIIMPLMDFAAATVSLDTVDPVTTELVRMRCANHHDCHT